MSPLRLAEAELRHQAEAALMPELQAYANELRTARYRHPAAS